MRLGLVPTWKLHCSHNANIALHQSQMSLESLSLPSYLPVSCASLLLKESGSTFRASPEGSFFRLLFKERHYYMIWLYLLPSVAQNQQGYILLVDFETLTYQIRSLCVSIYTWSSFQLSLSGCLVFVAFPDNCLSFYLKNPRVFSSDKLSQSLGG